MVRIVNRFPRIFAAHAAATALGIVSLAICGSGDAQNTAPPSAEKSLARPSSAAQEKPAEKLPPKLPAQIALLETHVRFEASGDSRKEIHALVKINDEAGARQFSRLTFSYNRAFQSLEIPLARITHANGGTLDVLARAITDNPDPAVVNFPAYQDIRVKSIRILGLEPDDTFEYRVVTTTTHHPLAPDFWFEHTFDRSGVVSHEILDLDLPACHRLKMTVNSTTPSDSTEKPSQDNSGRCVYQWDSGKFTSPTQSLPSDGQDVAVTTYQSWVVLSDAIGNFLEPQQEVSESVLTKAKEITGALPGDQEKLEALYNLVARKIATVDLPIGSTGFRTRPPGEILASGYATAEDKAALLDALADAVGMEARTALFGASSKISGQLPAPFLFKNCAALVHISSRPKKLENGLSEVCDHCGNDYWLVPSMEVAPFAVLPSTLRGKQAFVPHFMFDPAPFAYTPRVLPFPSTQVVHTDASIILDGSLTAKVQYSLRGDNELVLRLAFHQSPREKWDGVAQLLALSDGFRGKVTKTVASDPYETHNPFTVSYEITQPKFLDWSKKPLRVPALLPLLGLPDPPAKSAPGAPAPPIELGTPLDVEVTATLHLPEGTGAEVPAGTSVERDFATYNSHYSISGGALTASRHINFILKEIPADRAAEYNAFLHSVQNDESQFFTLERAAVPPATAPKQ